MHRISVEIEIQATPEQVWRQLVDVESWWPRSNSEHEGLEILTPEREFGVGTRIRVRERIAGIAGVAEGPISEFQPGERIAWTADATYRLLRIPLRVEEGVTWWLRPAGDHTTLGADVWARFPGPLGPLVEWWFKHVRDGVARDREHALVELRYLKARIERGLCD